MTRPPRIAVLDVDGTLTRVTSPWQYLHEQLGLWRGEGEAILARYLAGALDHDGFCAEDAALWSREGLSLERARTMLDAIPLRPAAAPLLRTLHARGVAIVLLSTGFVHVARRILEAAGSPPAHVLANALTRGPGGGIATRLEVSEDRDDPRAKAALARALLEARALGPAEALLVGDRDSDLELLGPDAATWRVERDEDLERLAARLAP